MSGIKRRVRKSLAFMNDRKMHEAATLLFDEFNDVVSYDKKKKSEVDKLGRKTQKPSQLVGVGSSRYQTAMRRMTPTTLTTSPTLTASVGSASTSEVKKALPNGNLYMGSFAESAPHRSRKYLWSDGCMYKGEWWRGKASRKVKFSWPFEATYEGNFKYDYMEGFGTFIESDGNTFIGEGD